MSIRVDDRREQFFDRLEDATGESNRAGALEAAARYYCHMHGTATTGALDYLLELSVDQANVTHRQIAAVLGYDTLPLQGIIDIEIGIDD